MGNTNCFLFLCSKQKDCKIYDVFKESWLLKWYYEREGKYLNRIDLKHQGKNENFDRNKVPIINIEE